MKLVQLDVKGKPLHYEESLQKRVHDVYLHAATVGKFENLEETLSRIAYKTFFGKPSRTLLTHDFAPHSFGFVVQVGSDAEGWTFAMNGGVIYHEGDGWSVHT